ncbi:hypothetical protein BKK56_07155 [Rodentibacter genomosp. 2]|uniref:Sel1 repeat family protein n=1 Tax=Rodentibacter caecimuris TaxID=1796644 RepID=A0ABX3L118_9PAST|nr:hypothetical protein BKK56_07155 [Rodentibacter genomosp. 2]OOF71339.1 hypothetical protein BKG89_00470 [Rodentibacter heylii]
MKSIISFILCIILLGCSINKIENNIATEKMLTFKYQDSEVFHDHNIENTTPPPRTQEEFVALQKKALSGDANSNYLLGRLYLSDSICNTAKEDIYDDNCEKAFHFFQKAVELNKYHSLALQWLGASYQWGMGTKRDWSKAIYFYERGAELGNLMSLNNLFVIYAGGLGGITRDLKKAKEYAQKSVSYGSKLYRQYIDNWDSFVEDLKEEDKIP